MNPQTDHNDHSSARALLQSQMRAVLSVFTPAAGTTPQKVFWAALNDHRFWTRYWSDSINFTVGSHDKILQWMSDRWPEGAVWPDDVPRPDPKPLPVETEEGATA